MGAGRCMNEAMALAFAPEQAHHWQSPSTSVGQVVSGTPASRLWISGERAAAVLLRQGLPPSCPAMPPLPL